MATGHDQLRPLAQRAKELFTAHPTAKSLVAGCVSGTCSTVLFQPFDLVKTRMQTASQTTNAASLRILPIVTSVSRESGLTGLWRGTLPSLVRTVPGVGIYLTSLNLLKTSLYGDGTPSPLEAIALGISARSFAGCLLLPATVIKTRLESGLFSYTSMSHAFLMTYKVEGFRGLFSGLTPTLLRDAPYSGLYFMFYTQLKSQMPSSDNSSRPYGTFICGMSAGLMASLVTHPFDVVKTKMQLERSSKNFYSAFLIVYQSKGSRGFFAGLAPRMIRRSLMSALTWTVFESLMKQVGLK